MISKENLKNITGEWYLYHHIANENALIPVIVGSFLVFFCQGGWLVSLCIWLWYSYYCISNNEKLNKDPEVLQERAWWLQKRKEQGLLEEYKRVLEID